MDEMDRQLSFGTAAWALARHLALILEATDSLPKGAVDRAIRDSLADVKALAALTENEPRTVMASGMLEGFQTSFRDWVNNDYQSSPESPLDPDSP